MTVDARLAIIAAVAIAALAGCSARAALDGDASTLDTSAGDGLVSGTLSLPLTFETRAVLSYPNGTSSARPPDGLFAVIEEGQDRLDVDGLAMIGETSDGGGPDTRVLVLDVALEQFDVRRRDVPAGGVEEQGPPIPVVGVVPIDGPLGGAFLVGPGEEDIEESFGASLRLVHQPARGEREQGQQDPAPGHARS